MKIFIFTVFFILQFFLTAYATGNYINADFFKKFNDDYLTKYIYRALANNHELKEANNRVEQYRFQVRKMLSEELPELSMNANYLGVHFPTGDDNFLIKRNSFILPFNVKWEADLLLKNKDKIRSRELLYKAELARKKGIYLSLLSDVASSYMNILLYDFLIKNQKSVLENKKKSLNYENKKVQFGISNELSLIQKQDSFNKENEYLENLIKNQKTMLYNFSSLIGESAFNYEELERGTIEEIEYRENIPDIINSDLIFNRPDVIEAENRLKSAKIDVTVAKKEFFPRFNLMALMFFDTAGGNFFNWDSSFAFLLAGLSQDLFNGGEKIANLKIKQAKFKELVEKCRQTDLIAIKEILNAINLIKQDENIEFSLKDRLQLEKKNLALAKKKLDFGIISNSDYLDYEINLKQKEQSFANAKTAKLVDYVTLYKALGGEL